MKMLNVLKKGLDFVKGGAKDKAKKTATLIKEILMRNIKKIAIKYLLKGVLILSLIIAVVVLVEQAPKMIFNAGKNALVSWVKGIFGIDEDDEVEFIPGAIVVLDGNRYKFLENEDGESVLKTFEDDANKLLTSDYIEKYAKLHIYTTYPDIGNSKYEGGLKVKRGETELKYQEGATIETVGADNFTVIQGDKDEQYVKKLVWKEVKAVMSDEVDEDGNPIQAKDSNGKPIYEYIPHVASLDEASNSYSASIYFLIHLAQSTSSIEKTNVKFMDDVLDMLDKDFDYEFSVSSSLGFSGTNWVNKLRDILKKDEYEEIKDSLVEKGDSFLETIANSNELKGLYSKMLTMLKSLGYSGKYSKSYLNGNGDFSPVGPPTLTKEQFVQALNEYNGGTAIQTFRDYAEDIYDWSIEVGVNPEYVITKAIGESSLSWKTVGNYNFWGLDTPNGSALAYKSSMEEAVKQFGEQVVRYCTEGTSAYSMCQARTDWYKTGAPTSSVYNAIDIDVYEELNCEVGTLEWVMCTYTWIGNHIPGSEGSGGLYVLKIIMTDEEFNEHCGYGTSHPKRGHTEGMPPTAYEQSKYTKWLCDKQRSYWTTVFGKFAPIGGVGSTVGTSDEFTSELTALIAKNGSTIANYAYLSKDHYITPYDASEIPEQSEEGDTSATRVPNVYGSVIGRAGYNSYATFNGRTYKLFRQDRGSYSQEVCSDGRRAVYASCGIMSASIVISGYYDNYSNEDIKNNLHKYSVCLFSEVHRMCSDYIPGSTYYGGGYNNASVLINTLKNNNMIVHVNGGPFSTAAHFIALLDSRSDGCVYVANPAGLNRGWVSAEKVVQYMRDGQAEVIPK